MAKRRTFDPLYLQVYAIDNLYLAWRRARKGKRGRAPAAAHKQRRPR